jgi:hypothetical protein
VLICKPNPELIKAVSRAISKSVGVDTCEIWGDDKNYHKSTSKWYKEFNRCRIYKSSEAKSWRLCDIGYNYAD